MRLRLEPGEQVIVATHPQARVLFWPFLGLLAVLLAAGFGSGRLTRDQHIGWVAEWQPLLQAAVLIAAAVLGLRLFAVPLLRWCATRYVLTSHRLLVRRGWGRRSEQESRLAGIGAVHVGQSLLQRMLRSGTLQAEAAPGRWVQLRDVPEVHRFRELVAGAIEEQVRPGRTEPVPDGPGPAGPESGVSVHETDPGLYTR